MKAPGMRGERMRSPAEIAQLAWWIERSCEAKFARALQDAKSNGGASWSAGESAVIRFRPAALPLPVSRPKVAR